MKIKKPLFWKNINFFSLLLLPLTLIGFIYNVLKLFLTSKYEYKIPIICVGNIYVGGTGKTPLSLYVYNLLRRKKFRPAIIRKYYSSHLDEIESTKKKARHFFSERSRAIAIQKAEQNKNNIIVMDDGLQDVSIKKNLNIVCFNSTDLAGNGFLLPAGPLRESLRNLNRYQIIVINGKKNVKFEKKLKNLSTNIKIYQSFYKIKNLKKFKNFKILAFAGIGNPAGFFNLLKNYGLRVEEKISYPDHYNYSKNEIKDIIVRAKKNGLKLLTTEKDYFRIKQLGLKKIDYVSVELKIIKYKSFEKEIIKHL